MVKPSHSTTPRYALALRKFLLSFFVVFTFIAYAIRNQIGSADKDTAGVPTTSTQLMQPSDSLVIGKVTTVPTSQPSAASPKSTVASIPTDVATSEPIVVPTALPTAIPTIIPPSLSSLPAPIVTPEGKYKDGTYDGPVVDAYYGNVQVEAVVQGGKLADVQFLDYPQDRRTSRFINQQAMPWLTQEAVQVQSANVDLISGATFTSEAFVKSLQSALNQAQNIS